MLQILKTIFKLIRFLVTSDFSCQINVLQGKRLKCT